jgi:two-component system, sensor histidine kinase and response regulator
VAALERAHAAGAPFPLVLLDTMMPEMDGFTLAERINENPDLVGATVMMLSSADRHADLSRCRELGVAAYLSKPVRQSELLSAIVTALGSSPGATVARRLASRTAFEKSPRSLRLLLAEDNVINQRLAVRLLEKRGHTLVVAGNGREAIAALDKERFDAVLMDMEMPEMDGYAATAAIRATEGATGTHIPIVAMTAHAMKGDREKCLEAGMDGYVSKPLQARKLFEAVEDLVPADVTGATDPTTMEPTAAVLDQAVLLERVGGDEELLREIATLFLGECPRMLQEVRAAIDHADAPQLRLTAHALKGAVSNFGARAAYEAVWELEQLGHAGNLTRSKAALVTLEGELHRLQSAVAAWFQPGRGEKTKGT